MILDATNRKIQIVLDQAKETLDCQVVASYVDFTSTATTPGVQATSSNGTSVTDIVAVPAASTQRKINFLQVVNLDSDRVKIKVYYNDNGTQIYLVDGCMLQPGAMLTFTDAEGWVVVDALGNIQVVPGTVLDVQTFTSNGQWTKPDNATFVKVIAVGGGGGGGGG
jgi:hypothetical protein